MLHTLAARLVLAAIAAGGAMLPATSHHAATGTATTVHPVAVAVHVQAVRQLATIPTPPTPKVTASDQRIASVLRYARAQLGKWYRFGSAGPDTFDCSGLIVAAYRQIGISLPHQSAALHYRGRPVSRSQLRPGDWVFLRPQVGTSGHVALYLGGGLIIEAPHTGARVRISHLYAFYGARRIL